MLYLTMTQNGRFYHRSKGSVYGLFLDNAGLCSLVSVHTLGVKSDPVQWDLDDCPDIIREFANDRQVD